MYNIKCVPRKGFGCIGVFRGGGNWGPPPELIPEYASVRMISDQLFVALYTVTIHPSVHNQLIRPLFGAYIQLFITDYVQFISV